MSKDIWHTKDEIPSQESRVLWKSGNVVCGGRFDTHYKCFCGSASQFVDLKKVSRWAYIDDFLALEQELIRTRKALDVALCSLQDITESNGDFITGASTPLDEHEYADMMLKEIKRQMKIKTALEQKDK